MDQEEYEDNLEFWNTYNWDWNSPSDVKRFVDDAITRGVYQNAWGSSLQDIGEENFYTNWWLPVQDAIKSICSNFTREDLKASIQILLEGDEGESDPSILDALLKYAPGFPIEYPEFDIFIDKAVPEEWMSDWEEFEWYSFIDRYIVWTLWPPETLARSSNVDVKYLWRIFEKSINGYEPYQTFRARVALATNPICPPQIIEFLFKNRHKADWLFRDCEEDGLFSLEDNAYVINEGIPSLEDVRDEAEKALGFIGQINRNDFTGRGAHFVENL